MTTLPLSQLPSLSEGAMFSVVRIALPGQALATGFVLSLADRPDWYLVTCAHVFDDLPPDAAILIQGPGRPEFVVGQGLVGPRATTVQVPLAAWRRHPEQDVAVLPLPPGHEVRTRLQLLAFSPGMYPTAAVLASLFAVEDITMVGSPRGLWDSVHGFPIFRRGITATHAAVDHDGRPEGLVDVACFGGSSGSPILVLNEGIVPVKTGAPFVGASNPNGPGIVAGQRLIVLGMLKEAPHYMASGHLDGVEPGLDIRPVHAQALHLGVYLKLPVILRFAEALPR